MFKHKSHHLDYTILVVILTVSAASFWLYRFTPLSQKIIATFLTLGYFVWGVTHHKKSGLIDSKIVLEYAGLAGLALVIIFSLIR